MLWLYLSPYVNFAIPEHNISPYSTYLKNKSITEILWAQKGKIRSESMPCISQILVNDKMLSTMSYVHPVEYYIAIKMNKLQLHTSVIYILEC